ncbi:MAG TPA: hypothetical protein VLF79_02865 [Candidatus Saccharimonadales bacterium]|nr:hypothetical protein [Candidatus Saccharimonadales bacterium]
MSEFQFEQPNELTSQEVAELLPEGLAQRLALLSRFSPTVSEIAINSLHVYSKCILEEHGIVSADSAAKLIQEAIFNEDEERVEELQDAILGLGDPCEIKSISWTSFGSQVMQACSDCWIV